MPTPLSGMDAFFWHLETATAHMHVASVLVLDPSTAPRGRLGRDELATHIGPRLHRAPPLQRRVATVPLGLDHPVWVTDTVDLAHHVRATTAPAPGDRDALMGVLGELLGQPLDRDRPLWEAWLIDGLDDGRVAVLTKTHHAAIDGIIGAELLGAMLDVDDAPDAAQATGGAPDAPEPAPNGLSLLAGAARRLAARPRTALRLARRLAPAAQGLLTRPAQHADTSPLPGAAPHSPFNGAIGPHRRVALRRLPLATITALKDRTATTVNDVLLAVVAGALRTHLDALGALPDEGLVALVPVAVEAGDDSAGNQVSAMLVRLPTTVEDPGERLAAAATAAGAGKSQQATLGDATLQQIAELLPAGAFAATARGYTRLRVADRHAPLWNLVASNVPGPQMRLGLAGARVDELYALGPIHETTALNLTAMSYRDQLHLGLTADRERVPDLEALAARLPAALAELAEAHDLPAAPPAAPPTSPGEG